MSKPSRTVTVTLRDGTTSSTDTTRAVTHAVVSTKVGSRWGEFEGCARVSFHAGAGAAQKELNSRAKRSDMVDHYMVAAT